MKVRKLVRNIATPVIIFSLVPGMLFSCRYVGDGVEKLKEDKEYAEKYKISENSRMEILKEATGDNLVKWQSNNIADYDFKIKITYGGQENGQVSYQGLYYPEKKEELLRIRVRNGYVKEVIDINTERKVDIDKYQHLYTFTGLLEMIQEVIDSPDRQKYIQTIIPEIDDTLLGIPPVKITYPSGYVQTISMISIDARFRDNYAYPELISIYRHIGNHKIGNSEYFKQVEENARQYLLIYEITEFFWLPELLIDIQD